jgi:ectoine hydroxylase-related dioxygenase (phytanoyl-CoA dioxygenase family)
MNSEDLKKLNEDGYVVIRKMIPENLIDSLRVKLIDSFNEHKKIQIANNNEIKSYGVSLHVILHDPIFTKLLEYLIELKFIDFLEKKFFKSNCILNSFSGLNNIKDSPNFSSNVHRDLRFFSGKFPMMINCLIMIDDFTKENGGTYILPKSHKMKKKPSDEFFFKNCTQITGKKGDILIFNSNTWHASAPNKTESDRIGIPITISKSFMKQLLDYPRAIGYDKMENFNYKLQQFLGYHSRVPASLNEWYQPEEKRLYKKNQD